MDTRTLAIKPMYNVKACTKETHQTHATTTMRRQANAHTHRNAFWFKPPTAIQTRSATEPSGLNGTSKEPQIQFQKHQKNLNSMDPEPLCFQFLESHAWVRCTTVWHTSTVWHTGTRYNATTPRCGFTLAAVCVRKRGVPALL